MNINKEYFYKNLTIIETIDTYIREIDILHINDYDDFYPLIDEQDISLYKDIDKDMIMNYTIGILLTSNIYLNKKNEMLYLFIVSYILTLKYISDCSLYKPYTFCFEFIKELRVDKEDNYEYNEYYEYNRYIKKVERIERKILKNIDFFSKK
jgi:hypothetical protein